MVSDNQILSSAQEKLNDFILGQDDESNTNKKGLIYLFRAKLQQSYSNLFNFAKDPHSLK